MTDIFFVFSTNFSGYFFIDWLCSVPRWLLFQIWNNIKTSVTIFHPIFAVTKYRIPFSYAYSEPCKTSKMEGFAKLVNCWKLLNTLLILLLLEYFCFNSVELSWFWKTYCMLKIIFLDYCKTLKELASNKREKVWYCRKCFTCKNMVISQASVTLDQ